MDFEVDPQPHTQFREPLLEQNRTRERVRSHVVPAPISSVECPKCSTLNPREAIDCRSCGVVFDRMREGSAEFQAELLALAKDPALIKQWSALLEDYVETGAHHAFVADCERAGALAFAAQKYSGILQVVPNEEIAKSMLNQITGLMSHRFQVGPRAAPWLRRAPQLNSLVILLSSTVLTMGLFIPRAHMMAWVGGIFLILSLLLKYLTQSR